MTNLAPTYRESIEKWISELINSKTSFSDLKDWVVFHQLMEKMYGSHPGLDINEHSANVINRIEAFYRINFYSFLSINPSDILFLSLYEIGVISSLILTMGLKVNPDLFMKAANSVPIEYHKNVVMISSSILENINLTKDSFNFLSENLSSAKENIFSPNFCQELSEKNIPDHRTPLRPINQSEIAIDTPINQQNISFMYSPLISVHNDRIKMLKLQLSDQVRLTESIELSLDVARNQIEIEVEKNKCLNEKISAKEIEIKDLKDEIDCLHAEKISSEELNEKYKNSLEQITALNAKIYALNKNYKNISSVNASLKEKIANFENEDASRNKKWEKYLESIEISNQKNEKNSERSFLSQPQQTRITMSKAIQVNEIKCEISSSPIAGENLGKIIETDHIEKLQNDLEEAFIIITDLKEQVSRKDEQINYIKNNELSMNHQRTEIEVKLRSEILDKKEEVNCLRQELLGMKNSELSLAEVHSEELLSMKNKLDSLIKELTDQNKIFNETLAEKEEKISELTQTLAKERKNIDSIEYSNIELREELQNIQSIQRSEQEDLKRVRLDLGRHLKAIEDKEREQNRLKESYENKVESLESKILSHIEKIEFNKKKYTSTIKDLEIKLEDSSSRFNQLKSNHQELISQNSKMEHEYKSLEERYRQSNEKSESLKKELTEALEIVKKSKKIISNLENEMQSNEYRLANMEEQGQYLNEKLSKLSSVQHENDELKNQVDSLKLHQQALVSKLVKLECDNEELNQHLEILRQSKRKSDSMRSLPILETDLSFTRSNLSCVRNDRPTTPVPFVSMEDDSNRKGDQSLRSHVSEFQERAERLLVRSERMKHPLPALPNSAQVIMREPDIMLMRSVDETRKFDDSFSLSTCTDVYSHVTTNRFRNDTESNYKASSRSGTIDNRNTLGSHHTDYQGSMVCDDQSSLKRAYQTCSTSTPDLTNLNGDDISIRSSSQRSSTNNKKGKSSNIFNKIKKSKALKFS